MLKRADASLQYIKQQVGDMPQHVGDVPQHAEDVQQQQQVEGTDIPVVDESYPEAAATWEGAAADEAEWYGTGEYDADGYYYHENTEGDPYYAEAQEGQEEYYTESGEQHHEGEYSEEYQWTEEYYQQDPEREGVAGDQVVVYDESAEWNTGEEGYYEHEQGTEGHDYSAAGYEGEAVGQEYWENSTEEQQYYDGDEWTGYEGEYAEPESNLHYGYEGDEHSSVDDQNTHAYNEQYLVEQPMETGQEPYHYTEFRGEYTAQQIEGFYEHYESYQAQQEEKHEEPEPEFDEAALLGTSFSPAALQEEPKPLRSILKKPKFKVSTPVTSTEQGHHKQQGTSPTVGVPDQPAPSILPKNDIGAEYITNITNGNRVQFYCQLCKCHFNTVTAKNLHLKGMKHIEMFIRTKANLLTEVITDVRGSPKV